MRSQYELSLRARGVSIDAGVNDAPLLRVSDGRSASMRAAVDLWLAPEGNALTASVSSLDPCGDAPLVDIVLAPPDSKLPPAARLTWSLPRAHPFEPFRVELPFALRSAVKTRLWSDVPEAIELDDAAHHAAIDAAMRLAEALARRDLDAVMGLVRYRTDETARAFDFDADENERAVSEAFDRLVADPSFAIAPARRSALRATPCAGERVFHITRDDGRELVVSRDEPAQRMQVYVAPIEGVWRVVR